MVAEFKRQILNSNAKKNAISGIWKEDYKKCLRRPEETKNTIRLSDNFAGNKNETKEKQPIIKITGCMKQTEKHWDALFPVNKDQFIALETRRKQSYGKVIL